MIAMMIIMILTNKEWCRFIANNVVQEPLSLKLPMCVCVRGGGCLRIKAMAVTSPQSAVPGRDLAGGGVHCSGGWDVQCFLGSGPALPPTQLSRTCPLPRVQSHCWQWESGTRSGGLPGHSVHRFWTDSALRFQPLSHWCWLAEQSRAPLAAEGPGTWEGDCLGDWPDAKCNQFL